MGTEKTRRDVLKMGVATGSLAVVGSLAGCNGSVGGGGVGYRRWLYAPGAVGDSDHYSFTVTDHRDIRDNEDELGDLYDLFASQEDSFPLSQMGVDYDEMNRNIAPENGTVIMGSFNESDVVSELEDNDNYEEEDDYEGYTVFSTTGQGTANRVIGVNRRTAVAARSGLLGNANPQDVVETLIDTDDGSEDRYASDNEDMRVVINRVGNGSIVNGSTQEETEETDAENGEFEGQVASGGRIRINGETMRRKQVLVFDSRDDVNTSDIEDWTETDDFEDVDDISVSQNGRRVAITGETDTDDFGGQSS